MAARHVVNKSWLLQSLLGAYLECEDIKAKVTYAQHFHEAVEDLAGSSSSRDPAELVQLLRRSKALQRKLPTLHLAHMLMYCHSVDCVRMLSNLPNLLLCSDQAAAAAAQLAAPTPLLDTLSQQLRKPDDLKFLKTPLLEAAAGSLVAAALLRCLAVEGMCSQLGSSGAYRLACSIRMALGPGHKSAAAVTDGMRVCKDTTLTAGAVAWLADVLCAHLAAVDQSCQLLLQQAGSQLQQVLQRTACEDKKLLTFWYSVAKALLSLERVAPGAISKHNRLWIVLTSFLSQLFPRGSPAVSLLPRRWNIALRGWDLLEELVGARLRHLLSVPERNCSEGWAEQWGCVAAAVSAAAWRMADSALPKAVKVVRPVEFLPCAVPGHDNVMVLLALGTLRLLRWIQQSQQGRPVIDVSAGSSTALNMALGTGGSALLAIVKLGIVQGSPAPKQLQGSMEALTLGLTALRPMVAAMAEGGAAGGAAVSWLAATAVPTLQWLSDGLEGALEEFGGSSAGILEVAPDLLVATAEAAETALRLAAAFIQAAARQPAPHTACSAAASVAAHCCDLGNELAGKVIIKLLRQAESAGGIQLSASQQGPFVNMGQSANKLALTVYQLTTTSPSGSPCWEMSWGVMPGVQPVVHAAHQAMAMVFQHEQITSDHMISLAACVQATSDTLLSSRDTAPLLPQACSALVTLNIIMSAQLVEMETVQLVQNLLETSVAALMQALEAPSPIPDLAVLLQQLIIRISHPFGIRLAVEVVKAGCLDKVLTLIKCITHSLPRGSAAHEEVALLVAVQQFIIALSDSLRIVVCTDVIREFDHIAVASHLAHLVHLKVANGALLMSCRIWECIVEQGLLPALHSWATAIEGARQAQQTSPASQQEQQAAQLAVQAALASRPCANLLCTNVRGVSEGRLRGRQCSGCRVVRYCSRECQLQHWQQHGPVCASLAGAQHTSNG